MEATELNELLCYLVHKFRRKQTNFSSQVNNTFDDLLQEARLAAEIAVRKYDAKKNTKIKTWVYACVNNHLMDIGDYERSKPSLDYVSELPELAGTYQEGVDFDLTMKTLLNEKEYRLYQHIYVEGYSIREIIRLKMFREREANCLHQSILCKSKSLGESLEIHLTQKKLQENWLADFHA